jgi:hypothetical protein
VRFNPVVFREKPAVDEPKPEQPVTCGPAAVPED